MQFGLQLMHCSALVVVQFWCTQTMTRAPAGVLVDAACQNDVLAPPVLLKIAVLGALRVTVGAGGLYNVQWQPQFMI